MPKRRKKIPPRHAPSLKRSPRDFSIVAVGASAGGLESVSQLLSSFPPGPSSAPAFVIIQHLSPNQNSSLVSLLSRVTKLKVLEITDGILVRPNHVYVLPPGKELLYFHPVLRLRPRDPAEHLHAPIDRFMESLARQKRSRAIGVVLSGTGSDGTRGLQKIRQAGGVTLVQSEGSAKFEGMPHAAISAGAADFVLSPSRIALKLVQLIRDVAAPRPSGPSVPATSLSESDAFLKILEVLRTATGMDFSLYRESSLSRRVRRRLAATRSSNFREYLARLSSHEEEVLTLRREILINVTSFFRDPSTFSFLRAKVLPRLLKGRTPESPLRIWVPGCASGEEVYSLVICILELTELSSGHIPFVVFGTDLSDEALKKAHAGVYTRRETRGVSAQRLKRFFLPVAGGYQVRRSLRENCLFVRHNFVSDTPFSRMDLISCRNVLIYFSSALQNKALPILHYALLPSGFLVLGKSENLANQTSLFSVVDRRHRVFRPRAASNPASLPVPFARPSVQDFVATPRIPLPAPLALPLPRPESVLLTHRGPAAVLVNSDLEILQFNGQLAPFLEPASGQASLNLLKMARPDLVWELRSAILRAKKSRRPVISSGLRRESDGRIGEINFEVIPVLGAVPRESLFWIVFDPVSPLPEAESPKLSSRRALSLRSRHASQSRVIARLEHELIQTKSGLQEIIQQGQASNEELQAANEEILSRNEELQSINEEFETAKEELQSSNEELTTLNEELEHRHAELSLLHADLTNLFSSLDIPVLILARDHRIRRFSQAAASLFSFLPSDLGRPLGDFHFGALYADVRKEINSAIESGSSHERRVLGPNNRWTSIRIHPYRSAEAEIQGATLLFVDVHDVVAAGQLVDEQREFAEAVIATIGESLLILDSSLTIVRANALFLQTFGHSPAQAVGASIFKAGNNQWDFPEFRHFLNDVLARRSETLDTELDHAFPSLGRKKMLLTARPILRPNGEGPLVLLTIRDKTLLESALNMSARLLRVQDDERRKVARELHDSTAQALTALKLNLNRIEKLASGTSPDFVTVLEESRLLADSSIKELRTVTYLLHPPMLDQGGLVPALRSFVAGFAKRGNIVAHAELPDSLPAISKDLELAVFRICQEALNNVYQHSESEVARVRLRATSSKLILTVSDEGKGFPDGLINSDGIIVGGDGVGVPSMQERVRELGGALEISSSSAGSTVRAVFPLKRG
ncbi:MAG TPA: chemotaxis protein CheB [Verrucomicrobiae bacterium]|nr:chemotaxis protein CheB [Verrucomicrobiae bacterium]